MIGLTVHEPYATLIAMGVKPYENRGRRFAYRGPLAIHAGQKILQPGLADALRLCVSLPNKLPLGCIVDVVDLVDCVEYDKAPPNSPVRLNKWACGPLCLVLENVRPTVHVHFRRQQGLFKIPDELIRYR